MKILQDIAHRPWPLPSSLWNMQQKWRNLLFCHWPISPDILRPFIPSSLQLDTFNQWAWIGIIVFKMEGIYLRGMPIISVVPGFAEINVRTYVQYNGKPGIFFLSLDVGDWASLHIAKRWYHLPYQASDVIFRTESPLHYCQSKRRREQSIPAEFKVKYAPNSDIFIPKQGTIDHFLTERYCLYSTDLQGNLYSGEIHHQAWPLQHAEAEISSSTLLSPFGIDITDVLPLFHFSKGVNTLFWNIKKLST